MGLTSHSRFSYIDGPIGGVDDNGDTLLTKIQRFQNAVDGGFQDLGAVTSSANGVENDVELLDDAEIDSGTDILHYASRAYTSADIGKKVFAYAAGPLTAHSGLHNVLRATVTGNAGSDFVLDKTAGDSVTGAHSAIGTDNTSAMQDLVDSLPAGSTLEILRGGYMMGAITLPSWIDLFANPGTATLYSLATSMFTFHGQKRVTIAGIEFDAGGAIYDGAGAVIGRGGHSILAGLTVEDINVLWCRFVDSFLTNNVAPVDTFNRHAVLIRNLRRCKVLHGYFENAMRIKAAGAGDTIDLELAFLDMLRVNENGLSLLNNEENGRVEQVSIHDITIKEVMESGNMITLGDDGSGVNQTLIDVRLKDLTLVGPMPAGTSMIQNRGCAVQRNLTYDTITCDNRGGSSEGTVSAIYQGNQTGSGTRVKHFTAISCKAIGHFDSGAFKWNDIDGGTIGDCPVEPDGDSVDYGHRCANSNDLLVRDCKVRETTIGMQFINVTDSTTKGNEIKDTTLDGISTETSDVSLASSVLHKNNRVERSGGAAFAATVVGTHTDRYVDNELEDNASDYSGITSDQITDYSRIENAINGELARFNGVGDLESMSVGDIADLINRQAALSQGLVAGWNFEDVGGGTLDLSDILGVETLTNHNAAAHSTFAFGDCAGFDGTNWLSHVTDPIFWGGEIDSTFALTLRLVGTGTTQVFVSKDDGASNREFQIGYQAGTSRFEFFTWEIDTTLNRLKADTLGVPVDLTEYLLIARYNAATDMMYFRVNDGADDTMSTAGTLFSGTAEFEIGRAAYGSDIVPSGGKIGRVYIWDRFLSDGECLDIWNDGNYVKLSAPVASGGDVDGGSA